MFNLNTCKYAARNRSMYLLYSAILRYACCLRHIHKEIPKTVCRSTSELRVAVPCYVEIKHVICTRRSCRHAVWGHSFSTYAQIPRFQTHTHTLYAQIMTSLWQQYIDMTMTLDTRTLFDAYVLRNWMTPIEKQLQTVITNLRSYIFVRVWEKISAELIVQHIAWTRPMSWRMDGAPPCAQ